MRSPPEQHLAPGTDLIVERVINLSDVIPFPFAENGPEVHEVHHYQPGSRLQPAQHLPGLVQWDVLHGLAEDHRLR